MYQIVREHRGIEIQVNAIMMGRDLNIAIIGGDVPHLGAVAVGVPRVSLQDKNKLSSSVSVITITGHKEDEIVRKVAGYLASKLDVHVVVSCGIHIDNIIYKDILNVNKTVDDLIEDLVEHLIQNK